MVTDTREYDAFGPWIDEVKTAEDVPRLYRDHPLGLMAARLVLKVPRAIARRDATADMDLYDHLLVVQERRLVVLSRRQDERQDADARGYTTRQVDLDDIAAVLDEVNLLDGRLHVHTRDGQVLSVNYNGSARDRVRRLVDALRVPSPGPPDQRPVPTVALTRDSLGSGDVGVVADYREVTQTRPDLVPLAWHGRQVLHPRATGLVGVVRGFAQLLSPMTLQAAVVASDGNHLEVFGRREWLVRGRRPVHSGSRLVVPLRTLDQVQARQNPDYTGATNLVLRAGKARLQVTVPEGSTTDRMIQDVVTS